MIMNRTGDKINRYLSESQSAYRKSRNTTDVIWVHRWMSVKAQVEKIKIFITGIDMSSAFDKIYRDKLLQGVEKLIDKDELRILRALLADKTLQVKIEKAEACPFTSNIGSP